ncbi:MAG: hypothetical protein ACLQVY_18510 [Limisphaerales bacterium]
MTRNGKTARLPLAVLQEKQQRIRQVPGVGGEYGPAAAPESLLPPKSEPN